MEILKEMGYSISYARVDDTGMVEPSEIARLITNETILIAVMLASNEIGTIEDAIDAVSEFANIDGKPNVVYPFDRESFFESVFGKSTSLIGSVTKQLKGAYYLMD